MELDIGKISKIDLTNYKKNPVVLWNHDYRSLPIGKLDEDFIKFLHFEFNPEIMTLEMEVIKKEDGSFELLEISAVPRR